MLFQVFLPIAIRAIKPVYVKMVITRLCYFFNKISQKVINEDELEHLMIHMVNQIRALGPPYLHKMWTYECLVSILN
jgi:hypothetical protein